MHGKFRRFVLVWLGGVLLMAFGAATAQNDVTNQSIPAVTQPAQSGDSYTDPVFGTKIIRLTGPALVDMSHAPYAYWPVWSKNSDLLWVQTWPLGSNGGGSATASLFDWANDLPSNMRALQTSGATLVQEGLIWSRVTNNKLWAFTIANLNLYSLTANGAAVVDTDLTARVQAVFPTAHHFWQMTIGGNDQFFAFTVKNGPGTDLGVAVYDRTNDILYLRNLSGLTGFDESHLTRGGEYLLLSANPGPAKMWDFVNNTITSFTIIQAHEDFGPSAQMVGGSVPEISGHNDVWDLAAFIAGTKTEDQASVMASNTKHSTATTTWPNRHASWQNLSDVDAQLVYLSNYLSSDQSGAWRPFFDEIWKIWTDGSTPIGTYGKYRRLCHHRSHAWGTSGGMDYRSTPKGSVSPDGRYMAYSSNFQKSTLIGSNTRVDVYIVKIPTEAEFAAGDYLSGSPTPLVGAFILAGGGSVLGFGLTPRTP